MNTHDPIDREYEVVLSSDRSFGVVFAAFFAIVAGYLGWKGSASAAWWLLPAAAFALLALARPGVLAPLNRLWSRLGLLLGRIVTPLVMLLLYVITIVPIGLLLRLAGKDLLRLRRDPAAASYWQDHDKTPRGSDRMRDQF